jgi:ferredoxin-NADP reductase
MANPVKIPVIVSSTEKFGDGIYKVTFDPQKKLPRFKPGQFMHLAIDEYDPQGGFWPESRVFSVASSPERSDVAIIYSVKGKFTERMKNELVAGKACWIKMPYGDFIIDSIASNRQDVILVAGGTGISPYLAFLHKEINTCPSRRIILYYGVRTQEHIVCKDILLSCIKNLTGFSLQLFCEKTSNPDKNTLNMLGDYMHSGILNSKALINSYTECIEPIVFLSGPPQMIFAFKQNLTENGIKTENIAIDEWE